MVSRPAPRPAGPTSAIPMPLTVAEPNTAISAVPPAGGWTVFVACIRTIAVDTATGAAMGGGSTMATADPTAAASMCPPITLRGWLKGTAGAPNTRTAVAPNDPSMIVISCGPRPKWINESAEMPTNEVRPLAMICEMEGIGGGPVGAAGVGVDEGFDRLSVVDLDESGPVQRERFRARETGTHLGKWRLSGTIGDLLSGTIGDLLRLTIRAV